MYDVFSYLGWCYSKIGVCVCGGGGVITICYFILVEDSVIRKLLGAGVRVRVCVWMVGWGGGGGGALDRCAHGFYKKCFITGDHGLL